jgi:predicted DNA-binding transcriptional regulator AlpA
MTLPDKSFYRVKEICAYLGISRMALWKRIKRGTAPELEKKGPRKAGYNKETLLQIKQGYDR